MNRIVFPLILALIVTGCGQQDYPKGAAGIGDPSFPELGNGGYDALHYSLDLDINPYENTLSGICTIDLLATQSLSSVNMDFIGLVVDQIYVDGVKADFERNEGELTITPFHPLRKGETYAIQITYHGSPEPVPSLGGWFNAG